MSLVTKHTVAVQLEEIDAGKRVPVAQAQDAAVIKELFIQKLKLLDSYDLLTQLSHADYIKQRLEEIDAEINEKFKNPGLVTKLETEVESLEDSITGKASARGEPIQLPVGTKTQAQLQEICV